MDNNTIIDQLKTIIMPYIENQALLENMTMETDFIKDLKINSANLVDIVLDVEEQFGIEIDNDSMAKMLTVNATIDIINEKLANAGK